MYSFCIIHIALSDAHCLKFLLDYCRRWKLIKHLTLHWGTTLPIYFWLNRERKPTCWWKLYTIMYWSIWLMKSKGFHHVNCANVHWQKAIKVGNHCHRMGKFLGLHIMSVITIIRYPVIYHFSFISYATMTVTTLFTYWRSTRTCYV